MDVQIIRTEAGDELVVLARRDYEELRIARSGEGTVVLSERDYDALRARAGEDQAEDAMADRLCLEARERSERDGDQALPAWLSSAILAGAHPIRAARKRSGLSRARLAEQAGVARACIAAVETGQAQFDDSDLPKVARALGMPSEWLGD